MSEKNPLPDTPNAGYALARARLYVSGQTLESLQAAPIQTAELFSAARIAGLLAAKRSDTLLPLYSAPRIEAVHLNLELQSTPPAIDLIAEAHAERSERDPSMEAITAVAVGALHLYERLRGIDARLRFEGPVLVESAQGRRPWPPPVKVIPVSSQADPLRMASPPPRPSAPVPLPPSAQGLLSPLSVPPTASAPVEAPKPAPPASPSALAREGLAVKLSSQDERLPLFLGRDAVDSAYLLGYLDDTFEEHCSWYGTVEDDSLTAVVLVFSAYSMPILLTAGDPIDVEAIFSAFRGELPQHIQAHIRPAHRNGAEVYYHLSDVHSMMRMGLSKAQYIAAEATHQGSEITVLGHRDTAQLIALYQHYPDIFFEPALLSSDLYFGVRENGELLSVAGIHLVSEQYNVAAVGNIITHPNHRGRGLATLCVRHLLDRLFERVEHIALNVRQANPSAIALYRKFGFTERFSFLEANMDHRTGQC